MEPEATEPSSDADADLAVGQTVGEYQVEGKLGQGGFGAVFKAVHPLIGKQVAIKVLSTMFSANREMVSRFIAEAKAVNQIKHRNIIDIFSFGQLPDGRHYYVMELIEGEPLDRRIARGPLTLVEALPILRPIARALDNAHAKGIAHRDLKAENIFLGIDSDGAVFPKLLDFGIAKLMGRDDGVAHKTRTGAPMGTPYYMSPEQTKGRNVDHRTDHYAFGVLVYVMLTQKFPLDGEDYMTILMRQVSDEPAPASSLVSLGAAGERVDQVIAWLMRKNPDERPPDLTTAVRALEEVAGVSPSSAAASSPVLIPSHISSIQRAQTTPAGPATSLSPTAPTVATGFSVTPAPITATPPPTRRRGLVIGAIAGLAVIGVVIAVVLSGSKKATAIDAAVPPPADAAAVAVDAAPVAVDAAPVAVDTAPVAVDAAPVAVDAAIDAGSGKPKPRPNPGSGSGKPKPAGSGSAGSGEPTNDMLTPDFTPKKGN